MHCREVGRFAAEFGRKCFNWSDEHCRQMFLLGLVHDCGYEYSVNPLDHPGIGSDVLKKAGYIFWREVRWHGIPHAPFYSNELFVLNIADLLIGANGKKVSLSQRLEDIFNRFGSDSKQFSQAKELVKEIAIQLKLLNIDLKILGDLWDIEA